MRCIKLLIVLSSIVSTLTGCSNEFEDIFSGKDAEVIVPVNLEWGEPEELTDLQMQDKLGLLVPPVLAELGYMEESPIRNDIAVVVNDGGALQDVIGYDGTWMVCCSLWVVL